VKNNDPGLLFGGARGIAAEGVMSVAAVVCVEDEKGRILIGES